MEKKENPAKLLKNLALVGMPGSGKTSVGQALAALLDVNFTDSDAEIEAEQGKTIPQIFAESGEAAFRQIEHEMIMQLLAGPAQVISTGGGAFVQPRNHDLMQQQAITLWLKADLDVLHTRTSRRSNRPLLQGDDPRGKLQKLQEAREPVYAKAHLVLEVDDRAVEETAARALILLKAYMEIAA